MAECGAFSLELGPRSSRREIDSAAGMHPQDEYVASQLGSEEAGEWKGVCKLMLW